ncbi:EI24 domain-containing protein [Tistrella bauzanensis]
MALITTTVGRTLGNLDDARMWRPLAIGIFGSAVLMGLLWWLAVGWIDATGLTGISWLDATISYAGDFAVVVISAWLLFVPITSAVMGMLIDDVAEVVEARSYPGLPPAKGAGFWPSLASGLRFGLFALFLNILVLPLYFVPVLNLVLFVCLNGVLLSREYFEMAALRRMSPADAKAMRLRHRSLLFIHGAAVSFLFAIPFVNLTAPIISAAIFTHLFTLIRSAKPVSCAVRDALRRHTRPTRPGCTARRYTPVSGP